MTVNEELQQRRYAAFRSCGRLLSGSRPVSLRERMASLAADAEGVHDLDERPDVYGDGVVRALERRVAALLGREAAVYFPTGTMAQQVALRYWAERTGSPMVAMHPLAHPELHERRALTRLTGLHTVWPTTAPRLPTPAELRTCEERFGTLMLELPLRDAGFVLPAWEQLVETVAAARELGARVHLDGARLWESTVHLGRPLPEIAALADSVYVSCYKSLGGLSGALLAGDEAFAREARVWQHRYGGKLFQQWPAALSALVGLERELPRLPRYVAHARTVAAALAEVPGARIDPSPPHTHQFRLWLPHTADALTEATLRLAEEQGIALFHYWDEPGAPGLAMTEVTVGAAALEWTSEDVGKAMAALLALL
ncbi:beta-eliminating lyase-related protein [Kitasatospora sp. NPDC093679]|uniref:threonine aldolase family protein n=1 Tax=Kitasatospora sp. NPDC093679 TaxID=3154983 RepID=UPI0034489481